MLLSTRQFSFSYPVWVEFGCGISRRIHEKAAALKREKAIVVSDPGIARAGLLEPIVASLEGTGLQTTLFTGVEPDPCGEICDGVAAMAKEVVSILSLWLWGRQRHRHGQGCRGSGCPWRQCPRLPARGKKIEKNCPPYRHSHLTGTGAGIALHGHFRSPRKKKLVLEGPQLWPRYALLDQKVDPGASAQGTAGREWMR